MKHKLIDAKYEASKGFSQIEEAVNNWLLGLADDGRPVTRIESQAMTIMGDRLFISVFYETA